MGGGKHNKCCCGAPGCPEFCIDTGTNLECDVDSAVYYELRELFSSPWVGDPEDDRCCEELWAYVFDDGAPIEPAGDCIWWPDVQIAEEPYDCGTIELEIISDTEATVTLTLDGGKYLVWVAVAGYSPLCNSRFVYSAADSDPPTTCKWRRDICVSPVSECCPDQPMPLTVYVTAEEASGEPDCTCIGSPVSSPLTRVIPPVQWAPDALLGVIVLWQWKGEVIIGNCETSVHVLFECVSNGAEWGRSGAQMRLRVDGDETYNGCSFDIDIADLPTEPGESCVPFLFVFSHLNNSGADCCPGDGSVIMMTVTM